MKLEKSLFYALLIYSPTIVMVPQSVVYIIISMLGVMAGIIKINGVGLTKIDLQLGLFFVISLVIFLVGKGYAVQDVSKSINDYVPYSVFIITTIYFAQGLSIKVLKYILYLIIFEVLIGTLQYSIGVQYFITPAGTGEYEFGESDLLYYNRVFGLSTVSSIYAMKIFVGVLLTYYLKFASKTRYILYVVLAIGLLITFNRTAIVSAAIFVFLVVLVNLKNGPLWIKMLTVLSVSVGLFFIYYHFDVVEEQFFRGREVDTSGRDVIFNYYLSFISDNPVFGNFFVKYWAELSPGRVYHAHNSYLQTFANMGIVIGFIVFLFISKNISRDNFIYVVPILVYSVFQYGILWGVSFLDIIFCYFLFLRVNKIISPTFASK